MGQTPCPLCGNPAVPGHSCPGTVEKMLGRLLDGRYLIDGVLGQGGMGSVYRAVQTSMQRPVAVKMLHPSLAVAPQFFERFKREAELASRLRHPNVITVFDFGRTDDGIVYFAMEMVDGQSLRQLVKAEGPLSLRRAVNIIEQSARGLAHAHAMGCVHRDLKPHNLMIQDLEGREYVKVLDFGLVKALEADEDESLTTTGQILGTPQYMSPEQAGGDEVDPRSDLYSLAAVFFYTLTGTSPYGANSARKALNAALTQPVPLVGSRRQDAPVPRAVDEFLRKALAKEPDDRHQDADEFIDDLLDSLRDATDVQLEATPAKPVPTDDGAKGSASRAKSASRADMRARLHEGSNARPRSGTTPAKPGSGSHASDKVRVTAPEIPRLKGKVNPGPDAGTALPKPRSTVRALWIALPATFVLLAGGYVAVFRPHGERTSGDGIPSTAKLDAAPAELKVSLQSVPEGAQVFEGGNQIGHTPGEVRLSRGMHRLSFQLEGREPVERSVDFSGIADDHTRIDVSFPSPKTTTPTAASNTTAVPAGKKKPHGSDIRVFE